MFYSDFCFVQGLLVSDVSNLIDWHLEYYTLLLLHWLCGHHLWPFYFLFKLVMCLSATKALGVLGKAMVRYESMSGKSLLPGPYGRMESFQCVSGALGHCS